MHSDSYRFGCSGVLIATLAVPECKRVCTVVMRGLGQVFDFCSDKPQILAPGLHKEAHHFHNWIVRMNRKLSSILFVAFIIAAATSYLVYRVTQNQLRQAPQAPASAVQIFVAARDLEIGTLIRDSDLTTADWLGTPPKGAVVNKDTALARGVVSQIYQGEPILETRLAAAGSGGGMAAIIRPGMRACAVRVDDVVGVSG